MMAEGLDRLKTAMARVLIFHHVLGLTSGLMSFKRSLEEANVEVVMPDMFNGMVFESVDEGLSFVDTNGEALLSSVGELDDLGDHFDAVIGISFGALLAAEFCRIATGRVRDLIEIAAFVPTESSISELSPPRVTVVASRDDPYINGDDLASFLDYQREVPDSSIRLFAGKNHFFMDDSNLEFSEVLRDLTVVQIVEVLEKRGIEGLGRESFDPSVARELVEIRETNYDDPRLIYCTQRYRQELHAQIGIDPVTDEEWQKFVGQGQGRLFVALLGERAIGTVTLARLNQSDFEVKRLWVDKSARGMSVGRRLMDRLEVTAREMGCKRLLLDTHGDLVAAIGLYRTLGYVDEAPYNTNERCQIWMSKTL